MSDLEGLGLKYFVLKPTEEGLAGRAARRAILAYANAVEEEDSRLAKELREWITGIEWGINARVKGESALSFWDYVIINEVRCLEFRPEAEIGQRCHAINATVTFDMRFPKLPEKAMIGPKEIATEILQRLCDNQPGGDGKEIGRS